MKHLIGFFLLFCIYGSVAHAESITITMACGAVGKEFELCQKNAQAWSEKTGHQVRMFQSPNLANDRLGLFLQIFATQSSEIDVVQIDVVWPGILGKHFMDLRPHIPQEEIQKHFPSIIQNNTTPTGELLAMPFFTDVGLLYYRKDLLEKYGHTPPQTWEALTQIAEDILEKEHENNSRLVGFVWQGKPYEGLTCNALEWIDSFGGGTILNTETGEISINNEQAIKALNTAASWVGSISPKGVLNYAEEDARGVFQSGNAIFMRNWPYAWTLAQTEGSPVKGKVGMIPLPKGGSQGHHTGTLGGWNLAVSKYSKHPEVAADLVRFLTQPSIQIERAMEGGFNPTIAAAYQDAAFQQSNPASVRLYDTLTNAVARPSKVTKRYYNKVSYKFWNAVYSVLSGEKTAEEAVSDLEYTLKLIKRGNW